MSVSAVAAAGTALAIYYVRRRGVCSEDPSPAETHSTVHSAPTTFMEDLFFLAEGLRYTYGETLGRWRTADLLIGLAYLCRKDPEEHPVSDIAQQGRPFGRGLAPELWPEALVQLGELERFFRYCSGLRERRPLPQRHYFRTVLDVTDEDLVMQELRAGVLKPSYLLVRDRKLQAVVLAIRGTHSFKDMFTSLTGASKPHHLVDANGVVLGYSHFGMLAAARWIKAQTRQRLEQALADNPGYRLKIIGHSLGGGTAALLTMMLREEGGIFAQSTCVAIACPSCMTLELAQSCSDYVTTVVHNADVIPTICPGSADTLRAEVMRSSWFGEFRRDVRSSGVVRAVENGLRGVGSATLTATSWTTSKLAACYQRGSFGGGVRRRQLLKRRNSDDSLAATAAAEEAAAAAATAAVPGGGGGEAAALLGGSPLSASAPAGSGFGAFAAALEEEQQQAAAGGNSATADGTAERLGSGGGWGLRVSQQLSGRGAAVLSGTSQMLQSTSGVLRSTSGLLMRRMWPAGGGEAAGAGNGGALAAAAAAEAAAGAAAADAAPDRMEIEAADEEELAAYADGFPLDGGDGDEDMGGEEGWEEDEAAAEQPGGGAAGSFERISISYQERRQMRVQLQLERSGSLEEEVSLRMHEVQQAVHDAEEEEQASGRDDSTVPAVIRPGGYGIGGGPSAAPLSPSKLDPKWKRQMYPAGRILHLVPARLVPGTAAYAAAAAAAAAAAQAAKAASAVDASDCETGDLGLAATGAAPEAAAASAGDAEAAAAGPAAAAAGGSAAAVPGGTAASGTATGPTVRPRHAAKLSVSDLIGGEEMLGRRSCAGWEDAPAGDLGGNGGNGDEAEQAQQAQQQAQQQAVQEEMLLLDYVPQEAYARIRLCRTVLSDHIIPNYLKSLESALQHIQEHAELVPVPVPAPAPTSTAAADKGATSAPASAAAAASAAPSAAAAPAAGEAVGARGGSHAAAAGPMSPSAGSSSPAAAAAAAALRSAAAKASFSKSSKHD